MQRGFRKIGKTEHVILGVDMQTKNMIVKLRELGARNISVIDYEAEAEMLKLASTVFYSPNSAKKLVEKSKKVIFHKHLDRRMRR